MEKMWFFPHPSFEKKKKNWEHIPPQEPTYTSAKKQRFTAQLINKDPEKIYPH